MNNRPTISVAKLQSIISNPDVRVVDASWYLPAAERDPKQEFKESHIPGALFFDVDACCEASDLPHMMPSAGDFAEYVGRMGIKETDRVVVYDTIGLFSAARVWWMFRVFGAAEVYVLDGGLPTWKAAGGPLESTVRQPIPASFNATLAEGAIVSAEEVLQASNAENTIILDARPNARFTAEQKEARPGLRSGHIPGSKSLPFGELQENGVLKSEKEVLEILEALKASPAQQIITSCGSGVTASVICLALESVGWTTYSLYDGAWTEWGGREDLPVATG